MRPSIYPSTGPSCDAVAAASVVVLENNGVLPLGPGLRLAVIGPLADDTQVQGGGSATVTPHYTVSILDAIRERAPDAVYEAGCSIHRGIPLVDLRRLSGRAWTVTYRVDGEEVLSEPVVRSLITWLGDPAPGVPSGAFSATLSGTYLVGLGGSYEWGLASAGSSRLLVDGVVVIDNTTPTPGGRSSFYGVGSKEVTAAIDFEAGKEYSVVVELTATPASPSRAFASPAARRFQRISWSGPSPWRATPTSRSSWSAPPRNTSPRGSTARCSRCPETRIPSCGRSRQRTPAPSWCSTPALPSTCRGRGWWLGSRQGWFGGQEVGHGVADVIFGDVDPGGRLPTTYPMRIEDTPAFLDVPGSMGQVRYSEGVFMGYRWYDRRDIEPRWCFGHGLSYTTFVFSSLDATLESASLSVSNVGPVDGVCVVQVYVGAVGGRAALGAAAGAGAAGVHQADHPRRRDRGRDHRAGPAAAVGRRVGDRSGRLRDLRRDVVA